MPKLELKPEMPFLLVLCFVGLIFGALLFELPSIAKYHGDECFYTDAAIRMQQTGDYLTPYAADGALRFAKPILPYWAVVAGYSVFGINFFASRVVFLIAGCTVILLTYQLSLTLFRQPTQAALAAFIIGSNVQLLTISIRSTPDALLCLFVLLSLLGFARIIFTEDKSWWNYVLAYVGAALAIETRGLPGVGVALYPLLFCGLMKPKQIRTLFEPKAIGLGLVVASAWFIAMIYLHGRQLWHGFYTDQVTENVTGYTPLDTLKNLQVYITGVLRHFLPWSALLAVGLITNRRVAASFWREKDKCWFLLGWFLFILAAFAFGSYYRTRYMIVAYPLLAVLMAGLLDRYAAQVPFAKAIETITNAAAVLVAFAGALLILAGLRVDARLAFGGTGLLALAGAVLWTARGRSASAWLGIGLITAGLFCDTELFLRPVFSNSPGPALSARLLQDGARMVNTFNLAPSLQAQMRVASQGKLAVKAVGPESLPTSDTPIVFAETDRAHVPTGAGRLEQVGYASGRWRTKDYLALLQRPNWSQTPTPTRTRYFIYYPQTASGSAERQMGTRVPRAVTSSGD